MTDSELSSGITSLSEALALSIGLLDGDITTTAIPNDDGKADSNEDTKLSPPNNKQLTPIEKSISILTKLQTQISQSNLISNNETLDDISTSTLELLGVDYQLGRAFLMLPTYFPQPQSAVADGESNGRNESSLTSNSTAISPSKLRKQNVIRAMEYYHSYLKRLEQLSENNNKDDVLLSDDTIKEYHTYLDMDDMNSSSDRGTTAEEGDNGRNEVKLVMNPSQVREMKIQRYKRKKALTTQTQLLQSKLQQRTRLNISNEETFDNHNYESLSRTLYIEQLKLYAEESLEELYSSRNELDMLDMSIKMEETRMSGMGDGRMNRMSSHATAAARMSPGSNNGLANGPQGGRLQQQQPMSMTQITQNPLTGELEYTKQTLSNGQLKSTTSTPPSSSLSQIPQRQNIKEGIFKPSWNLPTMSLDELADRERAEAIQRSQNQKIAEEQAIYKPKRYEQLVKDGMEDNEELVEASAKLDREWDDWKEENPRGSGNKMSERGDRNF